MIRRIPWVMAMAVLCAGCQTAPLGGTKWRLVEAIDPDPEDRVNLEAIESMIVEFHPDGRVISTVKHRDGTVKVQDQERFTIKDHVIEIDSPDYQLDAMYRIENNRLRVHSERFVLVFAQVNGAAE